jgi:hypothetical protein
MVTLGGQSRRSRALNVIVSGDVTMDWNLAREPLGADAARLVDTRASWQRGGAALLADLIEGIAAGLSPALAAPISVHAVAAPTAPIPPGDDSLNHSYSVWAPFVRDAKADGSMRTWRVESFLGLDHSRNSAAIEAEWRRLEKVIPDADVVVLDDAALGFRDHSDPELWRRLFVKHRPWVILKQSRPVASGPLWDHLLSTAADRLIVVLTIDDLRGRDVQVSRELSWERTAQDLLWELVHKPSVCGLSHVAHTVVSFGSAGAALITPSSDGEATPSCTLLFDPALAEGAWSVAHPGRIMGGTDCLTAALVRELLVDPMAPRLERGIQTGVAAARRLHVDGYQELGAGRLELGFPLSSVVNELIAEHEALERVDVPDPVAGDRSWTILEDKFTGDLAATAAEIAIHGPEHALRGVPLGRFASLVTTDRTEIEAFRAVAALIAEYAREPQSKPLSIAVFGPPGSGKSFGVKQIARSVAGDLIGDPIEFNLAQLRSSEELADAFHLVRDESLAGRIPLVFWDEFDTSLSGEPLGWLRWFLAPMQDGEFRQGQLVHPIGRSIFVFAGGTCKRVDEFVANMDTDAARRAKLPDFVSRLKGFVDVLGPNPREDGRDPYHVLRRAILLRVILQDRVKWLFKGGELRIDRGVLRAFLETKEYRHGARSLEAIVAMSQLSGKSSYERSALPAEPQLNLHVEAQDFLSLVQRPELEGDLLERLARAAHEVYCAGLRARGYHYGKVNDDARKISDALVPFDELPEFKQEQNRRNVRDIPAKLAIVGCVMVPCRPDIQPFAFTSDEIETLSQLEHERWMRDLGPGWRYGKPTDKAHKIHEAYVPWGELADDQKDKDRDLVREIPRNLHQAGYAIARTGAPQETVAGGGDGDHPAPCSDGRTRIVVSS